MNCKANIKLMDGTNVEAVDKEKYIGWPVWNTTGIPYASNPNNGFCFQDLIHSDEENNWKYWCSEDDGHPNKLGHEKIAETILNEI